MKGALKKLRQEVCLLFKKNRTKEENKGKREERQGNTEKMIKRKIFQDKRLKEKSQGN